MHFSLSPNLGIMIKYITVFSNHEIKLIPYESTLDLPAKRRSMWTLTTLINAKLAPQSVLARRDNLYVEHSRVKNGTKRRPIASPNLKLKTAQRNLLRKMESALPDIFSPSAFAYIAGRSAKSAAQVHIGMNWAVKIDLADFFTNIDEKRIFQTFRTLGFGRSESNLIAKICTYVPKEALSALPSKYSRLQPQKKLWGRGRRIGQLPQGAPTSGFLSNLICRSMDEQFNALAAEFNLTYTRYSDDILLSSRDVFDREIAENVFKAAKHIARFSEFEINASKSRIISPGSRTKYLGINIGEDGLTCPRKLKRAYDRKLLLISKIGLNETAEVFGIDAEKMWDQLKGQLEWIAHVEAEYSRAWVDRRKSRILEILGVPCGCWMCKMGKPVHQNLLPPLNI